MNRKIRVMILSMVLTVLLFGGTRLMAQDISVEPIEKPQTTPVEEKAEEEGALADTKSDGDKEVVKSEGNDKPEEKKETTEIKKTDTNNTAEPKQEGAEATKTDEELKAKEANKAKEEGSGKEDGTKSNPQEAPQAEPNKEAQGVPEKKSEEKKNVTDTPQIDTKTDKDLSDLQAKINAEQDPKKKAELQKEYNQKYLEKLGSSDKLDKEVLKRFTDKDKTKKYYELKDEYDKLKEKAENDKLSQKELDEIKEKIDKLNDELGAYDVPRLLDADERDAQEKLNHSVDVPRLKAGESTDPNAQDKFDAYKNAKKALKDALNPDKARTKSAEELKELLEAFDKAEKDLKAGIKDGSIKASYTDGDPTVRVFPLLNGSLGDELKADPSKDEPYYIPDNTEINLLLHINKDEEPEKFTFTIKAINKEEGLKGEKASNLAFLNGEPVKLIDNGDGSYSFTVDSNKTFGIAQLRFNIPGFKGAFHKGFDLEMDLNGKKVIKQFRITKKGYEDEGNLSGVGSDTNKDPKAIPEIDAGKTENAVVTEDTDKVFDFFTYLKKSNTYIDEVTFNSGNGESLPLNSVDITITVPKHNDKFAKMIHKSGLEYHKLENGKYQLKLNTKVFGKNLTKTADGKLMFGDKELTPAKITDVILENADKKVYIDEKGKVHDVNTSVVLEKVDTTEGKSYKVVGNKLYIKNGTDANTAYPTEATATFDKDGKAVVGNTTYLLKGDKLITYTSEHDVYDGYVTNEGDKANTDVTPTYEGKQVTIETKVTKDGKTITETSYGGTIVENAIYDKDGKIFKVDGYTGKDGEEKIIDSTGKIVNVTAPADASKITEVKDSNGKLLYKYFVDNEKTYRIVNNAVFKDSYIVDGLEYKKGLSLIDKFGKKMNVDVTKVGETYKFIRKVKKGDKEETEEKKSGKDGDITIKVSDNTNNNDQILVNSKNEVVKNDEVNNKKPYEIIGKKYYYDGKKFVKADGKGLVGKKFYVGYKTIDLIKTLQNTYKDGDKEFVLDKQIYQGSLNPDDYYKVNDKVYVKKGDIYISAEAGKSNDILTEKTIAKIVQIFKDKDGNAIEKVTDEADIFSAIQNAKFALRFPGFLAGKNIVYNVHAEVRATYKEPSKTEEGKFEEKSIFTSEKDETKKIDKFFTLKNENIVETQFNKKGPEALRADPKVNLHFFNIFYRNADDIKRDQLIADLLKLEETVNNAEEAVKTATDKEAAQEAYEKLKKDNKEKLELLDKFKYELNRLEKGAEFVLTTDKNSFEIKINGEKISNDKLRDMRSILWELSFKNDEGALFPDNKDSEIVIEDHNMDNRLVYDEIIVNDTKAKWDAAKKEFDSKEENKDKKFGNEEYFFLDQIKDIRFGVNPNFVEGRFVPLGDNFKLTGKEIIDALGDDDEATITKDNGIEFKITRDKVKGQVRIKVMKAFYKKNETYNKDDENNNYKFYSPAQKEYQDKMNKVIDGADKLDSSTTEKLNSDFNNLIKELHTTETNCYGILTKKFEELMTEVDKITNNNEKTDKLKEIKETLSKEIKKLALKYLDSKKGDYKNDDMRFNAIRIGLNPGITIGGAMSPLNTKKLGITSVIIPELDIPYTDEYGKLLTNKDMYIKEEIENILNSGIDQEQGKAKLTFERDNWFKSEESFRQVMDEAYNRVNAKIDSSGQDKITIKYLVKIEDANKDKIGMDKYTVVKGSDLDYEDLAVNNQSLKNHNDFAINPWYIGEGDKHESIEQRFTKQFGTGKFESKDEYKTLQDKAIDIAAYYMSKQGYDRSRFANKANYKLDKDDAKEGLFPSVKDWKRKNCYPGIGFCIEEAGKDILPGSDKEEGKFGALFSTEDFFELSYNSTNKGPDEEHPHTDKSSNKDSIDISDEKEEKEIDFTINVTVDKMTKEQRGIADALRPQKDEKDMTDEEKEKAKADEERKKIEDKNFKDNGYYEYKKSLIIDFLPEVFKLEAGKTKLTFKADRKKLMENGANKNFVNEEEFDKWQKGIEYFHTDDLLAYAKTITDKEKAEVLKKAIDEAIKEGKIKEGQKVQAVLAWVPNFEAPHGSENQFTITLEKLIVNKKKFKDFNDGVIGTNYTNHAAFGDKAKFYFGGKTVNINKDKHGKVNKYLQVFDKDGNIIDKDKADGWFKGGAELKFGDKFNYRIEYKNDNSIVHVPGEAHTQSEIKIDDLFATVKDKGLRPVLNGYITSNLDKYEVIYKIGAKEYSEASLKAAIKANKIKISDVTSVILKGNFDNGATKHFDIPMMIPELDAKLDENGNVYYIGKDKDKNELGKAKDFFNLKDLTDKEKDLIAENKVEGSNTVTVYLEKERFIRVFKEFLDSEGEKLKDLDNLEAKFNVYQIIKDDKGNVISRVKVGELKANKKNDFTDMLNHLPIFKKTTNIDKNGNVTVDEVKYDYELEEAEMPGFEAKVYQMKDDDGLGFVWKAKNTEKPEKPENPGEHPHDNPKRVKVKISVNKVWKVLNGGETPNIQVELYANGKATGKIITLGLDGLWSASFEDLPDKDANGNEIIYTVREVGEENGVKKIGERLFEVIYGENEDGSITITNKEVPPEKPEKPGKPNKPNKPNKPQKPKNPPKKPNIPKTGVTEDLGAIYFAFVLLLALVFIKKRYLVK